MPGRIGQQHRPHHARQHACRQRRGQPAAIDFQKHVAARAFGQSAFGIPEQHVESTDCFCSAPRCIVDIAQRALVAQEQIIAIDRHGRHQQPHWRLQGCERTALQSVGTILRECQAQAPCAVGWQIGADLLHGVSQPGWVAGKAEIGRRRCQARQVPCPMPHAADAFGMHRFEQRKLCRQPGQERGLEQTFGEFVSGHAVMYDAGANTQNATA